MRTLTPASLEVVPARRADGIACHLENWGRWAKTKEGKGADCMTGAVCERARRAAVGDLLARPPWRVNGSTTRMQNGSTARS